MEAQTEAERNRASKWFLILPKALLRQVRRGGKKGQSTAVLAKRFDCLVQRDWKTLLRLLRQDEEFSARRMSAKKNARGTKENQRENTGRKREMVLKCMAKGQISRAVKRIRFDGVANLNIPNVKKVLKSKFPACHGPLPNHVTKGSESITSAV